MLFKLTLLLLVATVSGCSYFGGGLFRNANDDYQSSRTIDKLVVPEGLDDQTLGEVYKIEQPAGDFQSSRFETPRPASLSVNTAQVLVELRSIEGGKLLLASYPPADVWSQAMLFLAQEGLSVASTNIQSGAITTLPKPNELPKNGYYTVTIESGLQPDVSEVSVSRISNSSDVKTQQDQADFLLEKLGSFLKQSKISGDSMLAQNVGGPLKAILTADAIIANVSRERFVSSVEKSLSLSDLRTYDQDLNKGVFHIDEPISESDKPGWFSRWFLFKNTGEASPYTLNRILAALPANTSPSGEAVSTANKPARALKKVPGYLVVIQPVGLKQQLLISDGYGRALPAAETKLLLNTIYQHLL